MKESNGIANEPPDRADVSPREAERYARPDRRAGFRHLDAFYLADETAVLGELTELARATPALAPGIAAQAARLVQGARARQAEASGLHAFLNHYDLSSREGVALMCLAESLLRIPDPETADELIADKLGSGDWRSHLGESDSLFVNASTWALMLTGSLVEPDADAERRPGDFVARLVARLEEPVVRSALRAAMRIMAEQFVMARTIEGALRRAASGPDGMSRHSFDMLGEAALSRSDADRYQEAYAHAIATIGETDTGDGKGARPSISIKLSALCPRYEYSQRERAVVELSRRVQALVTIAANANVGITLDAEEADRLSLSLAIFERVYRASAAGGWSGFGLAVQAYQKRALPLLRSLQRLAADCGQVIPVRLVKGAYWDTEIKRAQEQGLADFPVFTRKSNTDVSYLACARLLLEDCPDLHPQFATHNAHTVAWVRAHGRSRDYEFQRLHGMGEDLYDAARSEAGWDVPCRVYAPVGAHEDLLPYLVRRLLENGANTSFVNQLADSKVTIDDIVADPVVLNEARSGDARRPDIRLPVALFPGRRNAAGFNFANESELADLLARLESSFDRQHAAVPLVDGESLPGRAQSVREPAAPAREVGTVTIADTHAVERALATTVAAFPQWNALDPERRACTLERAADLAESRAEELTGLCMREAGKTLRDAHADVREAVDFLRYYAGECRIRFAVPARLPGPTGESNTLALTGRGVFACISPWNFPAAIFTGQIAAALAAGNCVVAKPAPQTPLTGAWIARVLLEAGVPGGALAFLPGDGTVGEALVRDVRLAGVAFTGSTATAQRISRTLAARDGPLPALIAETGGLNAMIADSSALPEQLVVDATASAFNSAGQRCSALRVLCVQHEIADRVIALLRGHMDELAVGDPRRFETDVGPVIDPPSLEKLERHWAAMTETGTVLHRCRPPARPDGGYYFPPGLIGIDDLGQLGDEAFGPILHVLRFEGRELDSVIDAINGLGYGLTLGVHTRVEATARHVCARARVGNCYVNRNMIGAVVGSQPFGGMGLSGTGPKAGGPHYLLRFANEKTVTVNTAAVGGNADLLNPSNATPRGANR